MLKNRMTLYIEPNIEEKLKALAKLEKRSLSNFISKIVQDKTLELEKINGK